MNTEELTRFLIQVRIPLIQIKSILIHSNRPEREWGVLCGWVGCAAKNFCPYIILILEMRRFFLEKGFPAVADGGGIDFWCAIIIIEKLKERSDLEEIAEVLRDNDFDFMSSCQALSHFFDITAWPPNILLITKNEGELTSVISWPL